MKPMRLRGWIQKYGHLGVLMAAGYLAAHHLWRKKRLTAVSLLLALSIVVSLCFRRPPQAVRHVISLPAPSLSPAPVMVRPPTKEEVAAPKEIADAHKQMTLRSHGDIWTIERRAFFKAEEYINYVDFFKNGEHVERVNAAEMSGMGLQFEQVNLSTSYPIIAVTSEPGAGHLIYTRLYAIRHGKLICMVQVGAENGGPIFRDYDGDGKMEWVFDDFNWYEYYSAGPQYYLIYKERPNGKLKLWKRVVNKTRTALPHDIWQQGE